MLALIRHARTVEDPARPAEDWVLDPAGSLVAETLQYALALGRVSSVDDMLLDAAGAGLAGLTTRRWRRRLSVPSAA